MFLGKTADKNYILNANDYGLLPHFASYSGPRMFTAVRAGYYRQECWQLNYRQECWQLNYRQECWQLNYRQDCP